MTTQKRPKRPDVDIEFITPKASRILHGARWEESVKPIISYTQKNTSQSETIPTAETWGKALKATGGLIAIGWVDNPNDGIDKITFYHPEDRFKTIHNINQPAEQHVTGTGYPQWSGYIYDDTNAKTLTPTVVTLGKIQKLFIGSKSKFIRDISLPANMVSLFTTQNPDGKLDWENPSTNTTTTPHALEKIKHCGWNLMEEVKYQYNTQKDKHVLSPEDIETTLLATGGEVAVGWYDTQTESVRSITFFSPDQDIGNVRFATVHPNLQYGSTLSDIKESLNVDHFRPIFMSVEHVSEITKDVSFINQL